MRVGLADACARGRGACACVVGRGKRALSARSGLVCRRGGRVDRVLLARRKGHPSDVSEKRGGGAGAKGRAEESRRDLAAAARACLAKLTDARATDDRDVRPTGVASSKAFLVTRGTLLRAAKSLKLLSGRERRGGGLGHTLWLSRPALARAPPSPPSQELRDAPAVRERRRRRGKNGEKQSARRGAVSPGLVQSRLEVGVSMSCREEEEGLFLRSTRPLLLLARADRRFPNWTPELGFPPR